MSRKGDTSLDLIKDETSSVSQVFTNLNISDSEDLIGNSNPQHTLNSSHSTEKVIYKSALLYDSANDSVNTITSATIVTTPPQHSQSKVMSSAKMTSSSSVPQGIPILPINNNNNNNDNSMQESPKLLATSVGRDVGGRLLPSSSTISLLSLNTQQNDPTSPLLSTVNSSNSWSSSVHKNITQQRLPNTQQQQQQLSSTQLSQLSYLSGVTASMSQPINRRVSFTSPTMSGSNSSYQNNPSRPITISRTGSFSTGYAGAIQISRPLSSSHHHHQHTASSSNAASSSQQQHGSRHNNSNDAPDSPPLDPTSLTSSPSNFYLSHSSPPGSLKSQPSSYIQMPRLATANPNALKPHTITTTTSLSAANSTGHHLSTTQLQHPQQLQLQTTPTLPPMYQITRQTSIPNSIGGRSPDLLPVSSNMPPMTPLNLSIPNISSPETNAAMTHSGVNNNGSKVDSISSDENDDDNDEDDEGVVFGGHL